MYHLLSNRNSRTVVVNGKQPLTELVEIITAIRSDHSAITLSVNGLDENERGPSFWKFNSTLINDQEYCNLRLEYKNWLEEFKEVNDKRVQWDLIKYKIRQRTIIYSKAKTRQKREKVKHLEESLRNCTTKCDSNPSKENLEEDDVTCFVRDKESYISPFVILESFGSCSGLRVNHEKTETLALGNNILHGKDFNNHRVCKIIKILGV